MDSAASISRIIAILPEEVPYNPERDRIAAAGAKLSPKAFEAIAGLFTAITLVAACSRIVYYYSTRGKLFADDILIIFATCCLVIATGFLYYVSPRLFMMEALNVDSANFVLYSKREIMSLFGMLKWLNLFLSFVWTANYAVKLSFLVFFRGLIRDVSRGLSIAWWFVLAFTILSWLFNVLQNPVNCGWNTEVRCYPYPTYVSELGWVCSVVDIVTDAAIIIISVLLLRKSLLRLSQKLRILTFTCLNIFCIAIALSRMFGGVHRHKGHMVFRLVYTYLLMHTEACIAVIMGGITAFRTVFAAHSCEREHSGSSSFYNRVRSWLKKPGSNSEVAPEDAEQRKGGKFLGDNITRGTLRGLRTFIRRHEREPGYTAHESTANESQYDPLQSYHNYIRGGNKRTESETLERTTNPHELASSMDSNTTSPPMPTLQCHNMA
ncbi:hypothetical protein DM02DRAFT_661042 [Periconia macrospinosa]|uniref:Rhodopsin domain-containing protein n=1 Tax=Periconia macrospinosa TaxID=97972 RepID=A0A2V1D8N8_9PLEO|nr:hypothetical protein DM02DRAFT_661042 [Periconia macrospinosa]